MEGSVLMCGRVMGGSVDYSLVGWLAGQMSAVLKVEMSPFVWGLAGRAVFITVKNKVYSL